MGKPRPGKPRSHDKAVTVVGLGNIGAALIPHLARMRRLTRVTLIDNDIYEKRNLAFQDILPGDVGKPKAVVQARRLHRINPSLEVEALFEPVQNVPLGRLRCDVILADVDSMEARRVINEAAWALGAPWIDSGVRATDGLLARVTVYVPGRNAPCIECGWHEAHYRALEQAHPCLGGGIRTAPTQAPLSIGALAAALQAIECQKLLLGDVAHAASGRQVLIDAMHHSHFVTRYRRLPQCRFDHRVLGDVRRLSWGAGKLTFGQVLDLGRRALGADGRVRLRVEGRPFVRKLQCLRCRRTRGVLRLRGRFGPRGLTCRRCGGRTVPVGFDIAERIDITAHDQKLLARTLRSAGFRPGEIFSIGTSQGREVHYEIQCV